MKRRTSSSIALAALLCLAALLPAGASAAKAPAWKLRLSSQPTHFVPGKSGRYLLIATNVGSETAEGAVQIAATLPPELVFSRVVTRHNFPHTPEYACITTGQEVSCSAEGPVPPGFSIWIEVRAAVPALADPTVLTGEGEVSGGGAAKPETIETSTTATSLEAPFDFLPGEEGFAAPAIDEEGNPATLAGSHPFESIADLGFPTVERGSLLTSSGHPRDIAVDLPPGMSGNPAAVPILCTEALLSTEDGPGCPPGAAVGTANVTTQLQAGLEPNTTAFFSMVPTPGSPATFAFDAAGAGIFVHVNAVLRSESDYGITGATHDAIARDGNPAFAASVELWGQPTNHVHDFARGNCFVKGKPCDEVEEKDIAFLSLPGSCTPASAHYSAHADSWEEPTVEKQAGYESASLSGEPAPLEDCEELTDEYLEEFTPSFSVHPTTGLAESPTGLNVDLHQPQELSVEGFSQAATKDVSVTFPPGLEVNASSAAGLGACSPAQIGMKTAVGETPPHFSAAPSGCPDSSKLGTVEVATPLLAQHNEAHEVEYDPETGDPIPEPVHGSLFLAQPFQNPFGSLIAVYLTIEDPKTGIFAKLAGEVTPNPVTGQLTTTFEENPQLPAEDIKVHLFEGSRAGLQTPPSCGTHTTQASLTPWSASPAEEANGEGILDTTTSFQVEASPAGGCPPTGPEAPNTAVMKAGTISPAAGTYTPLIFRLARGDGTQRFAGLEVNLPEGLSAKLAGVAQCSDAQIAAAIARSHTDEGALEQANPSCPAASRVGTLTAGAGAGPTPFYVQGGAYLAGPYKGAPLSFVFITPAIAGPFDLGTVVVRSAVYLDPTTAAARAVSDPFPQILHGIPLDLRSVALRVDRPSFTRNPTSCAVKQVSAALSSVFGKVATLADRFQVGGCKALAFKPKLSARLFGPTHRGAHPALRAVLRAKPTEAGIAKTVVTLPHSEFIDQAHFRTICTRVQFAANQCPAGSIYGHVRAFTPLLDFPLEGAVYLRSSTHELPDVVFALRGPPSMPIAIDAVGRVDSVNGGIRTSFETVPDAPLEKLVLNMQGKKKGLFQNSTNICKGTHRVQVQMDGQNGKAYDTAPELQAKCHSKKRPRNPRHKR